MDLTDGQRAILATNGHILVTGGPGSGKTTVSILKAAQLAKQLNPGQKVLFLSFARSTISRVIEAIASEKDISSDIKLLIHVETYHAFFWRILKTYGYLIGLPRRLKILPPPDEAIALSVIRSVSSSKNDISQISESEFIEKERLARELGSICFGLFAPFVNYILSRSSTICKLVNNRYPHIILDEFQDTNQSQWDVVKLLGNYCHLIALADPEQRIYDSFGASPNRLMHFVEAFSPVQFNLASDNHRSRETDILLFGNDILTGKFRESYIGIEVKKYIPFGDRKMADLITTIYRARRRVIKRGIKNWSLAILVPTKKLTRLISDALNSPPAHLKPIKHYPVIDIEETILSAEVIAFLMQSHGNVSSFGRFIELLVNYFKGRGGEHITRTSIKAANDLSDSYIDMIKKQKLNKKISSRSIILKTYRVYTSLGHLKFTGNPDNDWASVRNVLDAGECPRLKEISKSVRNTRLLDRGAHIRQQLSDDWITYGEYKNALMIVKQAFVKEYFEMNSKPETGVTVMNIHKSKGKQFDEVVIYEDSPIIKEHRIISNQGRIVISNDERNVNSYSRQLLRVCVTRSRFMTTILTPSNDPCVLLADYFAQS